MSCLLVEAREWEAWPMCSVRGVMISGSYKQKRQDVSAYRAAMVSAAIAVPTRCPCPDWTELTRILCGGRDDTVSLLGDIQCSLLSHCQGQSCTRHWGGDVSLCTWARAALGRAPDLGCWAPPASLGAGAWLGKATTPIHVLISNVEEKVPVSCYSHQQLVLPIFFSYCKTYESIY